MPYEAHKRICETVRRSRFVSISIGAASMALSASLLGCAMLSPQSGKPVDYAHQMKVLELELKKKNQVIEDLRERNFVLEHRQSVILSQKEKTSGLANEQGDSVAALDATPVSPAERLTDEHAASLAVAGENGEHFLYSKILETYRTRNQAEMQTTLRLLLRTYPESVFADNALYLSGLLASELGDWRPALTAFDQLIREYPHSNKVVSALFSKATVQKQLGKKPDALRGFQMVRDLFPGSPEASRVSLELKLLNQTSSKRRET